MMKPRVFRDGEWWRVKCPCDGGTPGFEASERVWDGALSDAHFHLISEEHALASAEASR